MEMSNSRYVEGALQGYPFDILPKTSDTHLMILSGEHADEAEKLFANTIWYIEKTKRNAKTVNREPFQQSHDG